MTNSHSSKCPRCGEAIPENAPGGLCPSCVFAGAAVSTESSGQGSRFTPPALDELAPHFPDLEILEIIGVGGMGAVYQARQPRLDRKVALKVLHLKEEDPAFEERFNREARVLARLNHPNIVTVFDFGTAGPYHFLIMELIDGVNLRQAMQAGRFSSSEALTLVQEMCSALKSAHEQGILHRDIKPENILLDSRGRLKIADFGIAKLLGPGALQDYTLTRQDAILGSPQYMAPEQIESPNDVDQRADIYSLGVVFYELLTGELPLGRFAAPSEKNNIDARIDEIVFRTLEKEREARYQSAEEVSTSVDTLSQSPPPERSGPKSGEKSVARFATLSAILTAVSFPLIFVPYFSLSESNAPSASSAIPGEQLATPNGFILFVTIALVVLGVITPPLGFFLGISSLREIRQSCGQLNGLSRSTFAVVTWPLLISLALISNLLPGPMRKSVFLVAMVLSLIALCWAIIPPLRRWARREADSLSPIFIRLLLALGLPALLLMAFFFPFKSTSLNGESPEPRELTRSVSSDPDSTKLMGQLEAAKQLPFGSQRALTIASVAEEAALADKPEIASRACDAITEGPQGSKYQSLANTARYKCALILARAGFTIEGNRIAHKITSASQKRTVLLKIAQGDFDDNSIPPLDR